MNDKESVNQEQNIETVEIDGETYIQVPQEASATPKVQPKRKYAEKVIKGIVIGQGDFKQIIPLEEVKKLAYLQCSYQEMATFFNVKEQTFKDNFRTVVESQRQKSKTRLVEAMIENAIVKMNPTLQIWLSKNWLGYTDQPQTTEVKKVLPWVDDESDESNDK